MPWLIAGAFMALSGGGIFAAGEGLDSAGNATLKIAAAAAIGFYVFKKVSK
jgi:hypothetical protein